MLRTGQIRVDGARAKSNTRLSAGMQVRLPILSGDATKPPPDKATKLSKEDRDFLREITLYEDDDMIALNKPAGLAVQGGSGQGKHIDGMLASLSDGTHRPVLVHRLDKDTTGVMVVARSDRAHRELARQFHDREVSKRYLALSDGLPREKEGLIEDTVIMLALGADIWVVLAGRVILTLIIMMLLAWLTRRWQTAPARPQTQGAQ